MRPPLLPLPVLRRRRSRCPGPVPPRGLCVCVWVGWCVGCSASSMMMHDRMGEVGGWVGGWVGGKENLPAFSWADMARCCCWLLSSCCCVAGCLWWGGWVVVVVVCVGKKKKKKAKPSRQGKYPDLPTPKPHVNTTKAPPIRHSRPTPTPHSTSRKARPCRRPTQ